MVEGQRVQVANEVEIRVIEAGGEVVLAKMEQNSGVSGSWGVRQNE